MRCVSLGCVHLKERTRKDILHLNIEVHKNISSKVFRWVCAYTTAHVRGIRRPKSSERNRESAKSIPYQVKSLALQVQYPTMRATFSSGVSESSTGRTLAHLRWLGTVVRRRRRASSNRRLLSSGSWRYVQDVWQACIQLAQAFCGSWRQQAEKRKKGKKKSHFWDLYWARTQRNERSIGATISRTGRSGGRSEY